MLALMRQINELFLKYPPCGARQMARHLWRGGVCIGRGRAVPPIGLLTIQQAPRISGTQPEHRVYACRRRG